MKYTRKVIKDWHVRVGVTVFTQPKGSTVSIEQYDEGFSKYLVNFGFNQIDWFHESLIDKYCGPKPEELKGLYDDDSDSIILQIERI